MQNELNGWLNIDKPLYYSSAKVVAIVKRILKVKKVGHGGTLDPLATGVLPICINKATKTVEKTMNFKKKYSFEITFGELRTTNDAEGEIIETSNTIPTEEEIKNKIKDFVGNIEQTPPVFSAIKIDGKRAYELAREGQNIELKPRSVIVYDLKFIGFTGKKSAKFEVECGKGFYIRSLGVDFSKSLNTVGYISYLRRLEVGVFNQNNIYTIDDIKKFAENNEIFNKLIEL